MSQGISGVLIILAPLLTAVGLLQTIFDDVLGGTLEAVFAFLVLLFCLGPGDLQRQVRDFTDAWDSGDEENARRIAGGFAPESDDQADTFGQAIAIGIIKQAYLRSFSVIFWFIILGPLGAVLYRSCHCLKLALPEMDELGLDFKNGVDRLLYILDWIPVRITAFTYALSGNFYDATHGWREAYNLEKDDSADTILSNAGKGALGLGEETGEMDDTISPAVAADMAHAMALRSLTIWIGVLTLITLTSWLS